METNRQALLNVFSSPPRNARLFQPLQRPEETHTTSIEFPSFMGDEGVLLRLNSFSIYMETRLSGDPKPLSKCPKTVLNHPRGVYIIGRERERVIFWTIPLLLLPPPSCQQHRVKERLTHIAINMQSIKTACDSSPKFSKQKHVTHTHVVLQKQWLRDDRPGYI